MSATRTSSPGSYDPAARVKEILEDETDAEVIFNGVQTVWNGIKLCPDPELSLACYKVYNDWIAEFQAYAPERFICNATLPTTGIEDCLAELHRCVELGLRTAQLESYPSGSFFEPTPEDDRFWAAAVELDMAINVHTMFFFPAGDLGSKLNAQGVPDQLRRAKTMGLDVEAGAFPAILWQDDLVGCLRALPGLGLRRHRGPHGLGSLLPGDVRRVRQAQPLGVGPAPAAERVLPAQRQVVYIVDEVGAANRYDIGVGNIMWGPDFPHSSSSWPVRLPARSGDLGAGRGHPERDRADHVAQRRRHVQHALRRAEDHRCRGVGDRTGRTLAIGSLRTGDQHTVTGSNTDDSLISADSHVVEPPDLFERRVPSNLRSRAPKLETTEAGSAWVVEGVEPAPLPATAATGSGWRVAPRDVGKPVTFDDVQPGLYDPAERIRAQDADSVQAELLYPSSGLWDAVKQLDDAELRLACVRAYNDWIADFSAHNPDRFIGLGKIPSTSTEDSRDELLRCVKELNLRGVLLDAWPGGGRWPGVPTTTRSGRR